MPDYNHYLKLVSEAIERLDFPAQPRGLYEPIEYTLDCGGKRLRPVLALAACEAMGKDPSSALNQALAIEMFHNFTLLHDDVMDHADVRRGRPTVHVRWDERTAILSGDAMLTKASMLLGISAGENRLRPAMDLFNATAMQIYEGQQYDIDFESRLDVTVAEYMEMIRLKTSVLLGCSVAMGALMADADAVTQGHFYEYGVNLGLAFQLRDDYLDTYGDPASFGKAIGGDILNDKKTWLLITALCEDKSGRVKALLGPAGNPQEKIGQMRRIYDGLGLPCRIQRLIEEYVDAAVRCLDHISLAPEARGFFERLALQSAERRT